MSPGPARYPLAGHRVAPAPSPTPQSGETLVGVLMLLAGSALALALLVVGARVHIVACHIDGVDAQCAAQSRLLGLVDLSRGQVDGVRGASLVLHATEYRDDDGRPQQGHDWRFQLADAGGQPLFDLPAGDALSRARLGDFVARFDSHLKRSEDAMLRVWFVDLRVLLAGSLLWLACTTVLAVLLLHRSPRARLWVLLVALAQGVPLAGLGWQLLQRDAPPVAWPGLVAPERLPAPEARG